MFDAVIRGVRVLDSSAGSLASFTRPFDADTIAWVNAVINNGGTVSQARERLVDNLIASGKQKGWWSNLDYLCLHAGENQPAALTDLVARLRATAVGSPTFTVDRGFTGQDAVLPTQYIDTNFNLSTAGLYSQNSAHLSYWSVGNVASVNGGCNMGVSTGATEITDIYNTFTDGNNYFRLNDAFATASGSQGAPTTRAGHILSTRDSATTNQVYQNGSLRASPNSASTAPANANCFIMAFQLVDTGVAHDGNPNVHAMSSIGSKFTAQQALDFFTDLRTYMTAIGVP